jgi:hypothetical protein
MQDRSGTRAREENKESKNTLDRFDMFDRKFHALLPFNTYVTGTVPMSFSKPWTKFSQDRFLSQLWEHRTLYSQGW